jgi:glycosyltransferase involved in cell wall biosynthesis
MSIAVLFLSRFNAFCGVSTYTEQLATALANRRVDVRALSSDFRPRATESDVPCIVGWSEDGNLADAFSKIDEHHPKIVHVQHEHGIFRSTRALTKLCRAIQENTSAKVIMTAHTIPRRLFGSDNDFVKLIRQVDGLIVHSSACKKAVLECSGIEKTTSIQVIQHGMLPPIKRHHRALSCSKINANSDKNIFRLLSMGFISSTKRYMTMLQAVMALVTRDLLAPKRAELLITGQAPLGSEHLVELLRRSSHSMGISNNVRVVEGFVPFEFLPYYYSASDMAIHTVRSEHMSASGSMRTDLSHGLPIVATKSGMTEDLSRGVLKVDGLGGLISRLVYVSKNAHVLKRLQQEAREFSRENSWINVAEKHLSFYERVGQEVIFDRSQGVRAALFHSSPWLLGSGI